MIIKMFHILSLEYLERQEKNQLKRKTWSPIMSMVDNKLIKNYKVMFKNANKAIN